MCAQGSTRVKTKLCVLVVVALVVWGMKRHYADARADDLWWILSPTAQLVGVITGTAFAAVPGEGYVSHERLFIVEKSCAGINFMIAGFAMMVFVRFRRVQSVLSGAGVLGMSLIVSYFAAIVVNAVRITIAMWLADRPVAWSTVSAADVHRIEGIVVYFAGLVLLHEAVQRLERRAFLVRGRS